MSSPSLLPYFLHTLCRTPNATALLQGSPSYPDINGTVFFYQTPLGALLAAEVHGLPISTEACKEEIFAFHIHEGNSCTGTPTDPFANTKTHYKKPPCTLHPYHAGDLPPLFGNDGTAFLITLTDRFSIREVLHRTVVIHRQPDDFTTQPSGNSGEKIACGVIIP